MAPISVEELHMFHRMERKIFYCLVIRLTRNPARSLLVMALWIWLQNFSYPNTISNLVDFPEKLIDALANEAEVCLKWLELGNTHIPNNGGLPLTTILVQKQISLQLFTQQRFTAITGIKSVLNRICARIFTDILQNILGNSSTLLLPLIVPGFPHPLFGTFTTPPVNFEELDLFDPRIWDNKKPSDDVTDDDKTMFLTFSRSFPVTEREVRHYFTTTYGDCIKVLIMGNGETTNGQVLFATMILNKVDTLDQILDGKHIAKFQVNGKHIWTRKYERRD